MILIISQDTNLEKQINSVLSEFGLCAKRVMGNERLDEDMLLNNSTDNIIIIDGDNLDEPSKFVAEIGERFPDVYLIYLTTNSHVDDVKKIYLAGIHYYSTKPVSDFEFRELFNKLIKRKITN